MTGNQSKFQPHFLPRRFRGGGLIHFVNSHLTGEIPVVFVKGTANSGCQFVVLLERICDGKFQTNLFWRKLIAVKPVK